MESSLSYQPPHGHFSDIVPADGWCAVDDDGTHTPLIAWALVRSRDGSCGLVPFVSHYDEPEGVLGRGTFLDTFEPVVGDLILLCGSRCEQYRDSYVGTPEVTPHLGAHPFPGSLSLWNCVKVIPAPGWCAVYSEHQVTAHWPLAAWALVEEKEGKSKDRWRGVVGLDGDGSVTGPTVASNFVRYSRCGTTMDVEHLPWSAEDYDADELQENSTSTS